MLFLKRFNLDNILLSNTIKVKRNSELTNSVIIK